MTRIDRIARWASKQIGEPVEKVAAEFERLYIGDLIGGYQGIGNISFDPANREATITVATVPNIEGGFGRIKVGEAMRVCRWCGKDGDWPSIYV